jgi:hypothetical protein
VESSSSSEDETEDRREDDDEFIHHPFKVKDTNNIVLNIRVCSAITSKHVSKDWGHIVFGLSVCCLFVCVQKL